MTRRHTVVTRMNHKSEGGKYPIFQGVNSCCSPQYIITFIHPVIWSEPLIFNNTVDAFVVTLVREKYLVEAITAHSASVLMTCVMKGETACAAL